MKIFLSLLIAAVLLGSPVPAPAASSALDEQDEAVRWLLEGRALIRTGRHFEGTEKLRDALKLAEQTGQHLTAALALSNLAEMARLYGNADEAVGYYREALRKYRLMGHEAGTQITQKKISELAGPDEEEVIAADRDALIKQAIQRVRERLRARQESPGPPGGAKYEAYLEGVKKSIESHWNYPKVAIRNQKEGRVQIEFAILKDGRVGNLRVVQTSGHRSMDLAAIAAIEAAAPFPKVPEQWRIERLNITFTFDYVLQQRP